MEEKANWKRYLKKENMVVLFLLGVLLMVIAIPTDSKTAKEKDGVSAVQETVKEQAAGRNEDGTQERDQEQELERQLEEVLAAMDGVGQVKVLITWKDKGEQIVEKDSPFAQEILSENDAQGGSRSQTKRQEESATVYVTDGSGNKIPYVKKTIQPKIEGIMVVAQGGGDPVIQKNISDVIQALFPVAAHKIKVVKMTETRAKG